MQEDIHAGASWIWADDNTEMVNQYAEFRRVWSFTDAAGVSCSLLIAAD